MARRNSPAGGPRKLFFVYFYEDIHGDAKAAADTKVCPEGRVGMLPKVLRHVAKGLRQNAKGKKT